ncbi:uncharacterized protein NPIL_530651 [Nephila pilipes]|uniref:Uncharacterized protein n=1 Tax=Nephila pilipes TaxID=299642 RepID=A0A8X6PQX9_NEPPI|nr:uncharacterized protein NPIL_530651 [Nephila pilipes]
MTRKGHLTVAGLTKPVQRFEENRSLEDRVGSGRPSRIQTRAACVAAEMETVALESAAGTSSSDTVETEAFARWALSKNEQDSNWIFNILWTDKAHFSFHGDINTHIRRIWSTSKPRLYTEKLLPSHKVTM